MELCYNTCTVCEINLSTGEEDGEILGLAIHCSGVFCLLRQFIAYRNTIKKAYS